MMETFANLIIAGGLLAIVGLVILFCEEASRMMKEEAERAELRKKTSNLMRKEKHLAKLKRQGMRVAYVGGKRAW